MVSEFFLELGFQNEIVGYVMAGMLILIIVLLFLVIGLYMKTSSIKKRLMRLTKGRSGASLEENIMELYEDNLILKQSTEKNKKDIRSISKQLETAYQKMGLVKYDAFQQMGGQLSFSLCLLDENNNGFIINSVHSTEGCYSYTKEIKQGTCDIDLGEEEAEALSIAMGD